MKSPSATALMTRATSVVGCTRSPMSALMEPTLAAQPPLISRRAARSVMRPSRPTTRSTRTISLASASFSATIALNSAAIALITSGSTPGSRFRSGRCCRSCRYCRSCALAPFGCAGSKRKPDREVPLPRRTQRRQQAAERTVATGCPAARRPFGSGARRSIWRRVFRRRRSRMSLVLPRRIQGSVLLSTLLSLPPPCPPVRLCAR